MEKNLKFYLKRGIGSKLKQVQRHAVPDTPIPAAITLEEAIVPSCLSITRILRTMSKGS